jgi:hypothetical protein
VGGGGDHLSVSDMACMGHSREIDEEKLQTILHDKKKALLTRSPPTFTTRTRNLLSPTMILTEVPAMISTNARAILKSVLAPSKTPLLPFVPKWSEYRLPRCCDVIDERRTAVLCMGSQRG